MQDGGVVRPSHAYLGTTWALLAWGIGGRKEGPTHASLTVC